MASEMDAFLTYADSDASARSLTALDEATFDWLDESVASDMEDFLTYAESTLSANVFTAFDEATLD